jgi:uncharacterized protein YlxP (DUF503 family)
VTAYVCLILVQLHFGEVTDLKHKRKLLHSLKAQVRQRFGATVSEIDHHDKWQRASVLCALVGGGDVRARAAELERFVHARHPEGSSFEQHLLSLEDVQSLGSALPRGV